MKKIALASAAALALLASGAANAAVKDKPTFQVGGLVIVWGSDGTNQNMVSDFYLLPSTSGAEGVDLIGGTTDIDGTGTAVVTGTFDPLDGDSPASTFTDNGTTGVLDAADTFTAFGLTATTDIDGIAGSSVGRFHVASNTDFNIMATATNLVTDAAEAGDFSLANVQWSGSVVTSGSAAGGSLAFGSAAQHPGSTAASPAADAGMEADMKLSSFAAPTDATQTLVFSGARRTAASIGSISEQSVQFVNTYAFGQDVTTTDPVTSVTSTSFVEGYDLAMGKGKVEAEVVYTVFAP